MSRNRTLAVVAVVVLLIGGLGGWWWQGRGSVTPTQSSVATTGSGSASAQATPTAPAKGDEVAPDVSAPQLSFDKDPVGSIAMIGQVQDADGEGVGGAEVSISTNPGRTVISEEDGSFTVDKLLARTYWVSARAGELVGGPVASPQGANAEPVIIRMATGITVNVRVLDDAGNPVAGLVVSDGEGDDDPDADASARARAEARRATSGADGKARLVGVRPGFAYVAAKAQQGFAAASVGRAIAAGVTSIDLTLKLRRGVLVTGRVLDEAGKPIGKVTISAPDADNAWGGQAEGTAVTDARGSYQLTLAPGNYRVSGAAKDFAPSTSALFAVGTTPLTAPDLILRAGGTIAGTVLSTEGAPVPFATIRIGDALPTSGGNSVRGTTADASGRFEVAGLPRGKVKVTAEHDGLASEIVEVELASPARRDDVELVLDIAGSIAGVVVDSAGAPVPEVTVTAMPDFFKGTVVEGEVAKLLNT